MQYLAIKAWRALSRAISNTLICGLFFGTFVIGNGIALWNWNVFFIFDFFAFRICSVILSQPLI